MDFNVDDNIAFIRARLPESAQSVSDNSILELLDIICDYDTDNDLFDISADPADSLTDDDDAAEAQYRSGLVEYVKKRAAKRRLPGVTDDIAETITLAELDYEDSISDLLI